MTRKRSFAPVVDARTRVLVLGSLPGEASLALAQYYANPRNSFWRLMEGVTGVQLTPLAYEDRLGALLQAGVGLWDVIGEAERPGSLDGAIRHAAHNDLAELADRLPALRAVGFNGGTSARAGRRMLAGRRGLALIDLPSSSPAYASVPFETKAQVWTSLKDFLPLIG